MSQRTVDDTNPWISTAVTWLFVFVGITIAGLGAIAMLPKADRAEAESTESAAKNSLTRPSLSKPSAQALVAKSTTSVNIPHAEMASDRAPDRVTETPRALPIANAKTDDVSQQLAQATPRPASVRAADADSTPPPAKANTTKAKAKTDPPATTGDATRRAAYKKAVAAARSAMAARNMPLAKRSVKTATDNAQTAAEVAEAGRLQTLQDHVEQFWDGVRNAVSKYEATQEIVLPDNNRVAVIDATREGISVMYEGRPREFRIETIPIGLLSSIAKSSFKATPGSKIVVGSFLAMDREGNRTEARKLWNEAAKAGETLGKELLPELDVPLAGKK